MQGWKLCTNIMHRVLFQSMEEAEDEATRPPPTGDEGGEESEGSYRGIDIRENGNEGDVTETGVQGFTRETVGSGAASEYMLEEGPLDDSTREGFSTSFYSLQVIFVKVKP